MNTIWNPTAHGGYPALTEPLTCDAAVIGGGLTGVLCAYALAARGLSVALFEEKTIAHGESKTARSTAKATVAHENIYSALAEKVSAEASRKYAAANLAGLRFLRELVDPRWERDMYLYALHGERRLRREYLRMKENGIVCEYVEDAPLPVSATAAVRLPGQLLLDPVELARNLCAEGRFRVFEHSAVTAAEKHSLVCSGHTVTAGHVIAATNYPVFHEASGTPLKLYRAASYAVAVRSRSGFRMADVMAFGIDGGYGYRYARDGELLIVSGETQRGAAPPNAGERLLCAARAASVGGEVEVVRQWSNNDGYTHDEIPYVGQLRCGLYTACGYHAWGMTNAASAAVILAEQICGSGVWYDDIFSPARNFLRGGTSRFTEHVTVAVSGAVRTLSAPPDRCASEVKCGCAEIINYRGRRAGAYRDDAGVLHVVDLRCPHLGCSLEWNPESRTWDCPCHGSRFDHTGRCVSNPSLRGIMLG
ncbi:MAG: FAD-dependent oxidoreductase [Eubacteriales bacterium]